MFWIWKVQELLEKIQKNLRVFLNFLLANLELLKCFCFWKINLKSSELFSGEFFHLKLKHFDIDLGNFLEKNKTKQRMLERNS